MKQMSECNIRNQNMAVITENKRKLNMKIIHELSHCISIYMAFSYKCAATDVVILGNHKKM